MSFRFCGWWHSVSQVKKNESVQRRFTKRLLCCCGLQYSERLVKLEVGSLELRRILFDLIYVYKLLFGMVDLNFDDFFALSSCSTTRGHNYKLFLVIRVWIFVNTFSVKELSQLGITWNTTLLILAVLNASKCLYYHVTWENMCTFSLALSRHFQSCF